MNIFKGISFFVAIILSTSVFADKVATLSVQQALLSSQAAEAFRQKMDEEFRPQAAQLAELEKQVKQMQGELQNAQAAGASQADLQQKNLQFQKLVTEYQRQGQEVQLQQREREQAFLKKMRPRLDVVIRDLIEKGDYDVVLNKQSTIYAKPELDITEQVVDLLNKQ
ncbi:OmpH family outer membrane protein [Aliamphritea ceti]|uniref:OmpH family outer membrane protein n=1 Tax=Aliamphritea ceti TaxID=1524258 RepID=UPI0021C27443|nr:OmpH family outer membrane protein [Aliamphritea ceti]